jgi:lipopolysaccharide/colanic/teichoic acid biosynthesis glycosyltransferase
MLGDIFYLKKQKSNVNRETRERSLGSKFDNDNRLRWTPFNHEEHDGKPGMTGLRQVSGRNQINDFEQVVELDCKYLENWRFSKDLRTGFCKYGDILNI